MGFHFSQITKGWDTVVLVMLFLSLYASATFLSLTILFVSIGHDILYIYIFSSI